MALVVRITRILYVSNPRSIEGSFSQGRAGAESCALSRLYCCSGLPASLLFLRFSFTPHFEPSNRLKSLPEIDDFCALAEATNVTIFTVFKAPTLKPLIISTTN